MKNFILYIAICFYSVEKACQISFLFVVYNRRSTDGASGHKNADQEIQMLKTKVAKLEKVCRYLSKYVYLIYLKMFDLYDLQIFKS